MAPRPLNESEHKLVRSLGAGAAVIQVVTHEEGRALRSLCNVVRAILSANYISVWTWCITSGFRRLWLNKAFVDQAETYKTAIKSLGEDKDTFSQAEVQGASPYEKIYNFTLAHPYSVIVLMDYDVHMTPGQSAAPYIAARVLLDARTALEADPTRLSKFVKDAPLPNPRDLPESTPNAAFVIIGTTGACHPRLQTHVQIIDFSLPTESELANAVSRPLHNKYSELDSLLNSGNLKAKVDEDTKTFAAAAAGLTEHEAVLALTASLMHNPETVRPDIILAQKKQVVARSGLLEFYDGGFTADSIGGLENLKSWLSTRRSAFTPEAEKFGLPKPKAVLLVGVPGTGKSLVAKAVGAMWGMPTLKMDIGRMFGSLLGQSESNIREAIKVAEAIAPCVLWIDEVEKALGSGSGGDRDGGTTSRLFGTILTWLNDKTSPVFVVATANDVSRLPPEFLRRGRFDEMFFVDLPNMKERKDIIRVSCLKHARAINLEEIDVDALAQTSTGFSGAEIDAAITASLYEAYNSAEKKVTTGIISGKLVSTVPLSKTASDQVTALREWGKSNAVSANATEVFVDNTRAGQASIRATMPLALPKIRGTKLSSDAS